jgi:protein-disulfide isomerase
MTKQSYIAIIAVIVVLFGLFALISRHPAGTGDDNPTDPGMPPKIQPLPIPDMTGVNESWNTLISYADGAPIGNPNAEYTLIEIGDFQCPQCGKARPIIEQMLKTSGGKIKIYFVNLPLKMHPHAHYAAIAALAAANQGKFWPMYNVLYGHQDELIPSEIQYFAAQEIPGFNVSRYSTDVTSPALAARVQQQVAELTTLKINTTPTVFVRKTSGGPITWIVGTIDTPDSIGLTHFAANPPWAPGAKKI